MLSGVIGGLYHFRPKEKKRKMYENDVNLYSVVMYNCNNSARINDHE